MRTNRFSHALTLPLLAAGALLLSAPTCRAQQIYNVSLDASALNGLGTFYVEFQLTDGSAAGGNDNSQATISNVSLSGGALGAVLPPTRGNVSGSLAAILTLRDGPIASGPIADFAQEFSVTSATSLFSFNLELTATGVDTPTPDKFSFLILDSTLNPLATDGPTGAEFVSADFTTTAPVPTAYSGTGSPRLFATVTPLQPTQVIPEPGSLSLLAVATFPGLGVLSRCYRRRR